MQSGACHSIREVGGLESWTLGLITDTEAVAAASGPEAAELDADS